MNILVLIISIILIIVGIVLLCLNQIDNYQNDLPVMHIINLADDRGKIRRNYLKKHLGKHKVKYVLEKAVDKKKLDLSNYDPILKNVQRDLTEGEIALARSHKELYKKLLKSNQSYFLIAEDDVAVKDDFNEILRDLLKKLPKDFDWIKLEWNGYSGKPSYNSNQKFELKRGLKNCTACYLISRNGAKMILDINPDNQEWLASDGVMDYRWIKKLNIRKPKDYYISPKIAWQEQENIVQTSGTHR